MGPVVDIVSTIFIPVHVGTLPVCVMRQVPALTHGGSSLVVAETGEPATTSGRLVSLSNVAGPSIAINGEPATPLPRGSRIARRVAGLLVYPRFRTSTPSLSISL